MNISILFLGISGDIVITNGDGGFSLGYLGSTLVVLSFDITNLLKFIQVLADTVLRAIYVLYLILNEHVETRPCHA